ncbi:DNA replication and repair protein RecF [Scopulibacillus darangshiensis]|uniref:DNA replication and repair protein RecF n=1 Tax=Scopulibacillus darangshiensis TaxID=442528 RepID=A0A4R2NKN3_9BACL|nr:DNA replication/repair protein RecF [Scopulibacillus darangshiensis]TCP22149.1 DNA replication and repair protein RecF [Scopulibacillus darangshiensis]
MILESIKLSHFRNYESATITFNPSVNVFLGENAQGKTNLLEAIYVLAMANSHRTSNDKELIKWDEDYGKIEGRLKKSSGTVPLELILSKKGKKVKVNHLEQRKLSQYVGVCNVVMFAPEDLNLVKGSPSGRRRFINMEIGQIQPVYIHDLSQYQKVLHQRNALLKDMSRNRNKASDPMLAIMTEQLIDLAAELTFRRFHFITLLRKWAIPVHASISRGLEDLEIIYKSSAVDVLEDMELSKIKEGYEEAFGRVREREIDRGMTLLGPHRDDLQFLVNGRDVQTFGSQGQQRTTALSLKLAEIELIKNEVGEYPLLLLDDVLSELDDFRQTHLLKTFKEKVQTFVTTTNTDGIDHNMLKHAASFFVASGKISEPKE